MTFRMPADVEAYLSAQADHNCTSKNAELVRAVRERMQRAEATTGESLQAHPAAADHDTALSGGPVTHALEMRR